VRRFLLLALLAASPCVSLADPILLSAYNEPSNTGMIASGTETIAASLFNVTVGASATGGPSSLFGDPSSPFTNGIEVPIGSTGTFEINGANAPGFAAVTGRLTDGSDEYVEFWSSTVQSGGLSDAGFGAGGYESALFGGLLTGDTTDFLRLVVSSNNVTYSSTGYTFEPSFRWEIWGTGSSVTPDPVSAPEPDCTMLLWFGFTGLGLMRMLRSSPHATKKGRGRKSLLGGLRRHAE